MQGTYFGLRDVYEMAKAKLLQKRGLAISAIDCDREISEKMEQLGLKPPLILFADTNWSDWFFGFVLNPATNALELWRLNRNGTQGFPMADWKEWSSPTNTLPWIVLSKPEEYTGNFK